MVGMTQLTMEFREFDELEEPKMKMPAIVRFVLPKHDWSYPLSHILASISLAASTRQSRSWITQGVVSVDGGIVKDIEYQLPTGDFNLLVGKQEFKIQVRPKCYCHEESSVCEKLQ